MDRLHLAAGRAGAAVIPIADENPIRRVPWCTLLLIAACTIIYFAEQPSHDIQFSWRGLVESQSTADLRFVVDNAGIPCELVRGRPLTEQEFRATFEAGDTGACSHANGTAHSPGKNVYLAALLSMFLHGSIPHLFGNMLFLWVFGNNIEDRQGWWRFVLLYLIGGAVATASHVVIDPSSTVPIVGASGAIAAVMGAYLVCYPKARIKAIIPLGIFTLLRKVSAAWLLVVWFFLQFAYVESNAGIAWAAHVGGFTFGVLVGLYWRLRERSAPQTVAAPVPA